MSLRSSATCSAGSCVQCHSCSPLSAVFEKCFTFASCVTKRSVKGTCQQTKRKMQDFAAIDFETANSARSSVCAVGLVVVRGGQIVDTFYSLIKPEPEYYTYRCSRVHGLCAADTADAPVFPDVWRQIAPRIDGLPLVAHNKAFDESCLKAVFRVYQMEYPDYPFYCTCNASRRVGRAAATPSTSSPPAAVMTSRTTTTPWQMPRSAQPLRWRYCKLLYRSYRSFSPFNEEHVIESGVILADVGKNNQHCTRCCYQMTL